MARESSACPAASGRDLTTGGVAHVPASFRSGHHSHLYHESHRGIPKGLKLVPGETQVRTFEHVAS